MTDAIEVKSELQGGGEMQASEAQANAQQGADVAAHAAGADAPNAATGAAPSATTTEPAPTVDASAGTSGIVANSPAEPKTFEQLVEERFLKIERAVVQLPHSIRTVMSEGSHDIEVFTQKVLAHLFANI